MILTQGEGTGSLYIPESVNGSKGVMPSGSGYEVIEIAGHNAVIEEHEYLPMSLAVDVSKDTVLTVEGTDRENVIRFAREILREEK